MVDLSSLRRVLVPEQLQYVQYKRVTSLPELFLFLEQLETLLPKSEVRTPLTLRFCLAHRQSYRIHYSS